MNPAVMTGYQGVSERDEPYSGPWDSSEALNQGRRGATPPHTYGALKNFVEPRAQGQRPRLDATRKSWKVPSLGGGSICSQVTPLVASARRSGRIETRPRNRSSLGTPSSGMGHSGGSRRTPPPGRGLRRSLRKMSSLGEGGLRRGLNLSGLRKTCPVRCAHDNAACAYVAGGSYAYAR